MAETDGPVLWTKGLCKAFETPAGVVTILRNLAFEVARGATLAVVGPSGSGKTTLLSLCAGLVDATAGEVRLLGRELKDLGTGQRALLRRGRVGFLFQDFRLIRSLSAVENVQVPLQLAGKRRTRPLALDILRDLGLATKADAFPHELSGGEQQRVALARALVIRPDIVFCDEPTGSLDRETARDVTHRMFALLAETGSSVVVATHNLELAAQCGGVLRLDRGNAVPGQLSVPA